MGQQEFLDSWDGRNFKWEDESDSLIRYQHYAK